MKFPQWYHQVAQCFGMALFVTILIAMYLIPVEMSNDLRPVKHVYESL